MRRARVFHTESFRLAALFAALFVALAGLLIAVLFWIVERTQTVMLMDAVSADIGSIENGYRTEGLSEAVEIVQQRLASYSFSGSSTSAGYLLMQDGAGRSLAGNLPAMTPVLGPARLPRPAGPGRRQHGGEILGEGVMLDRDRDLYLFVARDLAAIGVVRERLLEAFGWLTAATIVFATFAGIFFSVQFLRRIDSIARTCDAIVSGRIDDRIPLRGSDDELDRLAKAINRMLDRIATLVDNLRQVSSDVAHDLRTPLTHLRRRLELAGAKASTTEEYATAVSRAIADTDGLLTIFSALLRISQIESGTRLADFAEISLSDLLDHAYEMYRPVAEDHGHVLQREIAAGVRIRGDAELLTQLYSNLIENALRHTPPGTKIVIGLRHADMEGLVVSSVCDSGPGIPAAEREKVLRRFYRLESSRSTPGHGLGLALVAAIANLHQAAVSLTDRDPAPGLCLSIEFRPT